jgi:chromosome segregation ATPase
VISAGARFWLELADGEIVELGSPAPGAARRPAPEGEREGSQPDQVATLTEALTEARDRATQLQGENETTTATLEELEIWRGELERRLADTTTELAETRARLADAHAAAEMEALVARAEADALEQAARELTEAADQARSRS